MRSAEASAPTSIELDAPSEGEGFLLALVGQDVMSRLRDALIMHGLKPRQYQILGFLAARGPTGQRELGEALKIDQSIVVTMLNPLESSQLIQRRRSGTDRRRHVVSITEAGEHRLALAVQAQHQAEDALFAALSQQQRVQLHRLLATVREANRIEAAEDDECDA
jgi:DNA-binding MarR family transcriptional regulator